VRARVCVRARARVCTIWSRLSRPRGNELTYGQKPTLFITNVNQQIPIR